MPDHLHGILIINKNAANINLHPRRNHTLLSKAVCAFKITASKLIHLQGLTEFIWHRSFHDRFITDNRALQNIRHYIKNNPRAWDWNHRGPYGQP